MVSFVYTKQDGRLSVSTLSLKTLKIEDMNDLNPSPAVGALSHPSSLSLTHAISSPMLSAHHALVTLPFSSPCPPLLQEEKPKEEEKPAAEEGGEEAS